jgi:iron complex transport system ATP-binding protein
MIDVEQVRVTAGRAVILDGATLAVAAGEVVAVVGPNGAGKSTLLSVVAGDRRPETGRVSIVGCEVAALSTDELSRTRAVLGQDLPVGVPFTVAELVSLGRHPHRRDPANSDERDRAVVSWAIGAVGMDGWEDRVVATLSAGERLRAHFARVLAQEAPVLLLDEPTASLDLAHQEHVLALSGSMAGAGRAVVAVLHDLNAASRYANRIVVLDRGRVRADGSPREVLTADLLSSVYRHPLEVIDHPFRDGPLVLVAER